MTQRKFDFTAFVNRERAERTSFVKLDLPAGAAMGYDKWVIINRILYWMDYNQSHDKTRNFQDGRWWTYNSYKGWHEDMPGITERTMRDHFEWLESNHLVITGNYNDKKYDETKWYTVSVNVVHQFFDLWWECGCPEVNQKSQEYRDFLAKWQEVFDQLYPLTLNVTPPDVLRHPPLTLNVTPIPVEETVYESVEENLPTSDFGGGGSPAAAPDSFVEKTPAKKATPTPPARIPGKVGGKRADDGESILTEDTYGDHSYEQADAPYSEGVLLELYNRMPKNHLPPRKQTFALKEYRRKRLLESLHINKVYRKSVDHYMQIPECEEFVVGGLEQQMKPILEARKQWSWDAFYKIAKGLVEKWVIGKLATRQQQANEIRIAFTSPDGYPRVAIWREGNTWIETEPGLESPQAPKSKDEFIEHYQNKLNGTMVKNTEEVPL